MRTASRRRVAGAVAVLTAMASVSATVLLPSIAEAGTVTGVSPSFANNDNPSVELTFTTTSFFPQRSKVVITRVGGTAVKGDRQVAYTNDSVPTKTPHATFNLQDGGDGDNDGPANPGVYSVTITQGPYDSFGLTSANPMPETDSCASCFSIFATTPLTLTSISPSSMSIGESTNATFRGSGFTRGTRVDVLLPDGSIDPYVSMNDAPYESHPDSSDPDDQAACAANGDTAPCTIEYDDRTTTTEMIRRATINPGALTGARAVRIANTDGSSVICQTCFSVGGQPLQGVSPNAASNDTAAPTRIDFFGAGLPANTRPQLVFVGSNTGTSSRAALTIEGTNVAYSSSKVSADFDIRNAAPGTGAYQPVLVAADGSTHSCACRFSVAQPQPVSVTSTTPSSARQGDTATVDIGGTRLSRGVRFDFGPGITVTGVETISSTYARAQLSIASTATVGARTVVPQTTDGKTGTGCGSCFSVTPAASPSPSPSASASTSPRPSASPSPRACSSGPARVVVNTPTITATGYGSVTVSGVSPHSLVELQGYSQNHAGSMSFDNDTTPVDRSARADANGAVTFNDIHPGTNTRMRAREVGCDYGGSSVMEVRTQLSLQVQRTGQRSYTFSGKAIPARPGGLIVSLYRIVGSACSAGDAASACPGEVLIAQVRADAVSGAYAMRVRFPARDQNVRDEFVVKTGRDNMNAPGRSNARTLLIY